MSAAAIAAAKPHAQMLKSTSHAAYRTCLLYTSQAFSVNGTPFYYQCPYNEDWLNSRIDADVNYLKQFNVDGFYYDVAFTAVHTLQCFNEAHEHG